MWTKLIGKIFLSPPIRRKKGEVSTILRHNHNFLVFHKISLNILFHKSQLIFI
ncbi:MAG: hypothetical protein LBR79_02470 [Oscillospiraceae bacterium]|nr:hypothetical protein [Oscillospiraceae bacterium]